MNIFKTITVAAALTAAGTAGTSAVAQARSVAVVNPEAAISQSQAFQNAEQAIRTQFASQIQAGQTRSQALQSELEAAANALRTASQQPNADQNALRQQQVQLQQRQAAAQQELQQLNQPILLARAYATEQIQQQLQPAVEAAMNQAGVDLALRPEAVVFSTNPQTVSLTDEVVAQLNSRLQSVQITPPAGWQPGQAQAQAPAQQPQPQPQQ